MLIVYFNFIGNTMYRNGNTVIKLLLLLSQTGSESVLNKVRVVGLSSLNMVRPKQGQVFIPAAKGTPIPKHWSSTLPPDNPYTTGVKHRSK